MLKFSEKKLPIRKKWTIHIKMQIVFHKNWFYWIISKETTIMHDTFDVFSNAVLWVSNRRMIENKKHSDNADTSTSVTFDLVVWPWPFVKVKKTDVIRCRFLYCTLVTGMMYMGLILYEISPFVYFMWPLTFTCDLQLLSRSLALYSLVVFYVVECLYQKWSL